MVAWIIYFREAAEYNREYIKLYMEAGARLGVDVRLIIAEDLKFGVRSNSYFIRYRNEEIAYPDFAICRAIYPLLTRQLELMGIKVYNNSIVAEVCNDKAKTYQYLARTRIAMPDTEFYKNFQLDDLMLTLNEARVIKAVGGHGGSQVFLVDPAATSDKEISEAKKALSGSDLVVQPKIGNRNQDLRVYVIGKEIIAAVLRTSKQGFRANYSLGGEVRLYELNKEEKALVKLIIDQFDFGLVGIDFIVADDGKLIFNEIEDVVGARMLYKCSDINIAEMYLQYIINDLMA